MSGQHRLSSNYLYHFKRDPRVLSLVLKNGFRHNSWAESLPFFDIHQHSFTVCFCDIRFDESIEHRRCYGSNGIALKKDWGTRLNISPVRYIHRTSPGATEDYIELKNLYRSSRRLSPDQPDKVLLHYLVHCLLQEEEQLIQGDLETTVALDPDTRIRAQYAQRWLSKLLNSIAAIGAADDFVRCLDLLMDKIHALHNELERRDSFMRAYAEDFECPATGERIQGKVLYDEREWRSIVFLAQSDTLRDPELYDRCVRQGFLPHKYNLRFSDDDVVAIIAQDAEVKAGLLAEIQSGQTLLKKLAVNKVFTVDEFVEPTHDDARRDCADTPN